MANLFNTMLLGANNGIPLIANGALFNITATRGSAANAFVNGVLTSFSTNVLRTNSSTDITSPVGTVIETAACTNNALWCRDFTNAAYVKVNITAALTATGIDNSANSASTLTASAGLGTVLQTLVLGSTNTTTSFYVKRRTGVGTIEITDNGGTNYTDITALINPSTYTRVQIARTQANPVFGFRITTNGDAIDVDYAQVENSGNGFASTPILTTTVAVTRSADTLTDASFSTRAYYNSAQGTIIARCAVTGFGASAAEAVWSLSDGTANNRVYSRIQIASSRIVNTLITAATVAQANMSTSNTMTANVVAKHATAWNTNDAGVVLNNGTAVDDTSVTVPTMTTLKIGANATGGENFFGVIQYLIYYQTRLNDAALGLLTA